MLPAEGALDFHLVANDGDEEPYFKCQFRLSNSSERFILNLSGNTSAAKLYEEVSKAKHYKIDTFLLCYQTPEEKTVLESEPTEQIINYESDCSLSDLLKDSKQKYHIFYIEQKDGKEPVTLIVDSINPVQDTSDDHVTYAASLFNTSTDDKDGIGYALPSSTSSYSNSSVLLQPTKSSTGYVGLVNQAMTCYLNSLLQTLFMTPEFRNALYRWRYKGSQSDASKSIPCQLQRLFLQLETSKKRAVETTDLTKSFGWDSSEAWQQHDVQELCRVMFDALEETLKNTNQADLINQLYQGEMKDYVKCLKCNHENSRSDNYLDISLDIRPFGSTEPHSNLKEALKAFITPEVLDENNQYFCEKCNSKQDAHKGLQFLSFPYLLTFQLKRFTFDFNTLQRIKLHDRLEFPFFMSLKEYLDEEKEEEEKILREKVENDERIPNQENNHVNGDGENSEIEKEYELFSVLIHSGSALGGHYYAYIKSFEDQNWYCFNDQYVTEASEEDVQKSFGGCDKSRGGYYSSNYSSSTNAYMLMYRQVDQKHNKNFIEQSKWTSSLVELCNTICRDEEDEHLKRERQKNTCQIKLFCLHPQKHEKVEIKFFIDKDKTLQEATQQAWQALELEKVIPLNQCRLVKYDNYNQSLERSYEGEEGTAISKLLGGIRLSYGFDLLLECREKDKQFPLYEPGGTTLKVFLIDLEETEFDEPRTLHVPLTYTVTQLKEYLEMETSLSADVMRVAVWKEYHDFVLLETGKRTLKMEGFYKSAKIFVEGLSTEDCELQFKKSKFYERLEVYKHIVKLTVTLPFIDDVTQEKKELLLNVDNRLTLRELKAKIEQQIGVEADMFRVFRVYTNNHEYECLRYDEQLMTYLDNTKFIVRLGRALKHGESRMKLYKLDCQQTEHTSFLMEAVVHPNLSIKELKSNQVIPELQKQNINIDIERLRIRKKSYKNPGRIYPDSYVFNEDIQIGYSSEFYVEILSGADIVKDDDYLSIYVRRWNPEKFTLDPFDEVVLYKETTVKNLKSELQRKSDIPAEFIHIAKGQGMFPCTVSVLDIHSELNWDPNTNSRLGDYPLNITDDGSVVYYRDSREVIKSLTDDERRAIRSKENGRNIRSSSNFHRKEKALKIYTNGASR